MLGAERNVYHEKSTVEHKTKLDFQQDMSPNFESISKDL